MSIARRTALGVVTCVLAAFGVRAEAEDDEPPSLEIRVNDAIARGVRLLRELQLDDGSFAGYAEHPSGMTALCALALVESGVGRREQAIADAYRSVIATKATTTYGHAVRLLFFEALAPTYAVQDAARASLDFLVAHQATDRGGWAYPHGSVDLSNTQFALLGLRAARNLGLAVPEATLLASAEGLLRWRDDESRAWQAPDGGFRYVTERDSSGGMTAATLAGLAVLEEFSVESRALEKALRHGAKSIERAHGWLARRIAVDRNPVADQAWTPTFHYAHLWALERYGGLTARAKIGERDWYREGAEWLLGEQQRSGGWGRGPDETSFALLFLRRATMSGVDDEGRDLGDGGLFDGKAVARISSDVDYATDWLVAGPWPYERGHQSLRELPFDPRDVRVQAKSRIAGKGLAPIELNRRSWSDVEVLAAKPGDHALWLLATHLDNATDASVRAVLVFTFEDAWSVWLDGELLSSELRVGAPLDDDVRIPIDLAPGVHRLVVLAPDDFGSAAFGLRVATPLGRPIEPAVRVHASAKPKEKRP